MAHALELADVIEQPMDPHLDSREVAAFVDGAADSALRARVTAHMGVCADCRDEIVAVSALVSALPRRERTHLWLSAAAAAVILLVVWPRGTREPAPLHREGAVTTTVAPRAIGPVGQVDSLSRIVWSSVPATDGYVVRLQDAAGSVLWEAHTADTAIRIPPSVSVHPGVRYFWKVEAQTGIGRSVATELTEFFVRPFGR